MVSVLHALKQADVAKGIDAASFALLSAGQTPAGCALLERALKLAGEWYGDATLSTGESVLEHACGMALIAASLNLDIDARLAAILFMLNEDMGLTGDGQVSEETLSDAFGANVSGLVEGLRRLNHLRLLPLSRTGASVEIRAQAETLRKMLLAMVEDVRVVLLRLASRTQTLRFLTDQPGAQREETAHETLEIYAPLANRLGVWQLKWELEDLSFRFIEPAIYKSIARKLDEKRVEREQFIATTIEQLKAQLREAGIEAEVYGRPKHLYSIWNKMRGKRIDFEEVYDVRALRVLVEDVQDCYRALSVVHHQWRPIPGEFDDYIAQPKGNYYRSLHTAVLAEDGRPFEVQIRTYEMHQHSELGVAAHWRYKESSTQSKSASRSDSAYDDKIAWLRQLLSWRDEITDSSEWVEQFKRAELDDTIYVLTPQGRVIDLARGATPVDFAYRVHTDLGHRCRGARVDGQMAPLNSQLANGQRVEIMAAKQGGPSRDWLNPAQGYLATQRARQKVKQWFAAQDESVTMTHGRAFIMRELQREGQTQTNIETLAQKLGFKDAGELYLAAGRGEVGARALQLALRGETEVAFVEPEILTRRSKASEADGGIRIVGVEKIMTQLARCCKPVPPDAISGFVTRGNGVSIHRVECQNYKKMALRNPERVISAEWGSKHAETPGTAPHGLYSVDIVVRADDRQGLLRDISEVFSREKINVTAVKTFSRQGAAQMSFTLELGGVPQLQRVLMLVRDVQGVTEVRRA